MAGVQAGRLSIEIVAEIARLQQDLDKAKRAVNAASKDIAASAKAANDNLGGMAKGIAGAGSSSRIAGHHVQNLAFQFQDLAVGLASGQRPMTVFMQQGAQIGAIMGQAGIGVGGLAKQAGLMVTNFARAHPVLLAVTAATGVAATGLRMFTSEIEKTGELDKFAKSLGLTKKEMKELGPVSVTMGDGIRGIWRTIDEGLGLSTVFSAIKEWAVDAFTTVLGWGKNAAAGLYAAFVGTFNGIRAVWPMLPRVIGEAAVGAVNAAIAALERLINVGAAGLNLLVEKVNSVLGTSFDTIGGVTLGRMQNQFAGAGAAAGDAFVNAYGQAFEQAMSAMDRLGNRVAENILQASKDRLSAKAAELIDGRAEKAAGDGGKRLGKKIGDEAAKELQKSLEAALQFIERLDQEIDSFGKDQIELKWREIREAADRAPFEEIRDAILDMGRAWEAAFRLQADEDFNKNVIRPLMDESRLLGLVGEQRELASFALEEEAFKAEQAARGVSDVNDAWERYYAWKERIIRQGSALERDREEAALLTREIERLMGSLSSLGGAGSVLSGILGLVSGNTQGIGGPIGAILNTAVGSRTDDQGKLIARTIGDELRDVFGMDGPFGVTLTKALQSAGLGMMAGQMVGARGTGGQLGSAAGGILGGIAGQALGKGITAAATSALGSAIGGALGSAVPVIGTILGGVLGGVVSKALSGTKRGGATFGGSGSSLGVGGTWGNSSQRVGAASDLAGGVVDALGQIAERLGGTLGGFTGSISVREGNLRYDPTGRGISKTSKGAQNFGQDQEALMAAVIRDAISDGVFKGLSAGVERLIKSGGDIEAQLQKALAFEGVFDELERLKDPAGAAVAALEAEFAQLKTIFDEAGASAEEYAKLEELRALKRAEVERQGGEAGEDLSRRRELEIELMQLQGDYMGALAAARQQELAELPDALHALQQQVWAAQLLNDRRLLEIRLMEAQGNAAGALAAQRLIELEATHESLRGLKEQIWAMEDAQEAARAAEQLRDAWASVGDGIMEEVRRIRGLSGASDAASFATLMGRFNAASSAARGGDLDAAKNLPALSQEMLRVAELAATSRQELDRVRAQTAASLEATNAAIASLSGNDAALVAAASVQASTTGANDTATAAVADTNRALREELAQMRSEMTAALAAVAGNTGRVAKKLDDVTAASGGDAISTLAAA